MILAATDWLSISINLLLVIFVIVCLLMTLLILMQRPKQEGLGAAFGSNVTDQVFGARTTNVLQRGTVYLGSLFFILSLTLAVLIGHKNKKETLRKEEVAKVEQAAKADEKPVEPAPPTSLAEELPDAPPAETPATETPAPADAQPAPETTPPVETPAPPAEETTPPAEPTTPPAEGTTPPTEPAPPAEPEAPTETEAPAEGSEKPEQP